MPAASPELDPFEILLGPGALILGIGVVASGKALDYIWRSAKQRGNAQASKGRHAR